MRQLPPTEMDKNNIGYSKADVCPANLRFYSNACHVCRMYGESVKLKRCSSCKMIAYCSREHQREDWPRHKELCLMLGEIVRKAGSVFPSCDRVRYSDEMWRRLKDNLILLIQIKLRRSLLPSEMSMLQFPRSCGTCRETNPARLIDCTDCPLKSFCTDHYKDLEHAAKCETGRLCFWADFHQSRVPRLRLAECFYKDIPIDMREAVNLYQPPSDFEATIDAKTSAVMIWKTLVSEYLTRAYTFLYAMLKSNASRSDYAIVHVVGADQVELANVTSWETLLHHEVSPRRLTIVFVGPDISDDAFQLRLCDSCTAKGYGLVVYTAGQTYADYVNNKRFLKPNYVVGFNLGIHEALNEENDTWAPSVPLLAEQSCPFIMTSYTLQESVEDRQRLNRALGRDVKFSYTGKNPFGSLRPYRDFESEDFFYENQYLTIYNKLL